MSLAVNSPDDVRMLLLQIAAASSGDRARRARAARWFRAALELVEDGEALGCAIPAAAVRAAEELSHSLAMASAHAEAMLEQTNRLMARYPQR